MAKIKMADIAADVHSTREYEVPGYDGLTITLRKELSVGERRRIFDQAVKGQTLLDDGKTRTEYDWVKVHIGTVVAYLAEWSVEPEPSWDAIAGLKPEVFDAIEAIVDKHAEEYGPKRDRPTERQMSRNRARKTSGAATSTSVVPLDGSGNRGTLSA